MEPTNGEKPKATAKAAPEMTARQAAALVRRPVPATDKEGKPTGETREAPIREDEVLSFRDYGDRVVVVTVDGQKFEGKK